MTKYRILQIAERGHYRTVFAHLDDLIMRHQSIR